MIKQLVLLKISYLKVQDLFPPDGLQLFNTLVKVSVTTSPRSFVNWILSIFPRPFRANSTINEEAHAVQGLEHLPSTEFSTVTIPRKWGFNFLIIWYSAWLAAACLLQGRFALGWGRPVPRLTRPLFFTTPSLHEAGGADAAHSD